MYQPQTPQQERLAKWFKEWRVPIRRWLISKYSVPESELDDIAQEVFIRLMRYTDQDLVENPQSYLFRIATNVALERRELRRNSRPHEPDWLDDLDDNEENSPEAILHKEQMKVQIYKIAENMTENQWSTLLWHMEGLTYFEIAAKTGRTYRSVLRDLAKAYSKLRMELQL